MHHQAFYYRGKDLPEGLQREVLLVVNGIPVVYVAIEFAYATLKQSNKSFLLYADQIKHLHKKTIAHHTAKIFDKASQSGNERLVAEQLWHIHCQTDRYQYYIACSRKPEAHML